MVPSTGGPAPLPLMRSGAVAERGRRHSRFRAVPGQASHDRVGHMPPRRYTPDRLPEASPPDLPTGRRTAVLPDHDIDDEGTYRGLDFVDLDLTERAAPSVEFDGCHFTGTDLGGSELDKAAMVDCLFENCNLANLRASDGTLRRVRVDRKSTRLNSSH